MIREVEIRGQMIRLGQLLKVCGVIDSGAEVKSFLAAHTITVNGEQETRRGRQLHDGDVVTLDGGLELRVSTSASHAPEARPAKPTGN